MDLDGIISATQGGWNDTEKTILTYLQQHQEEVVESSVQQVAHQTFTSTSSVLRLSKRLGFSGFAELKYFLRRALREHTEAISENRRIDRSQALRADISETLNYLDNLRTEPLVAALQKATTVYLFSTGYSQRLSAEEFAKSLISNRKPAVTFSTRTEVNSALPLMSSKDLLMIISMSGSGEEACELAHDAGLRNTPVLAVTRLSHNPLAGLATYNMHFIASPITPSWHKGEYLSSVGMTVALDYLIREFMTAQDKA